MRQRPGTTQFRRCRTDWAPMYAATCAPPHGSLFHGTLVMARKPTAPGANGRRKSAVASSWVRAGGWGPAAVSLDMCGLLVNRVGGSGSGGVGGAAVVGRLGGVGWSPRAGRLLGAAGGGGGG